MKRGLNTDNWNIRGLCKQPRGEMVRAETTAGGQKQKVMSRETLKELKTTKKLMANKATSNFNFGKWVVWLIY